MSAFDPKRTFGPVRTPITDGNVSRKFQAPILSPALSSGIEPVSNRGTIVPLSLGRKARHERMTDKDGGTAGA